MLNQPELSESNRDQNPPKEDDTSVGHVMAGENTVSLRISFATLQVRLRSPSEEVTVNGLLDSGSDTTIVDRSLVAKLGFRGKPEPLTIRTIDDDCVAKGITVSFALLSLNGQEVIEVRRAWVVENLFKPKLLNQSNI
ncbi:hypothetical protein D915_010661 [Fasciola hepatica]|uniref:Peptidase A2 domain-containing protein n=1 Tax=Fasciola hepatica TaxID=6192 RepID=A0A4E0RAZ1_FASHE|nr:hypothetical protein D915_010661 [Fasciola hepatica]